MFKPTCLLAALGAAFVVALPPAAAAATVFDNLSSSQDGSDPVFGYGPLSDSFTSAAAGWLTGVSALLANGSTDVVGTLRASLHANTAANVPGLEIADLGSLTTAAMAGSGFRSYAFTPAAAVPLSAGVRYWIALEAVTPNAVSWSWSTDLAAPGVAGEFNHSALLGAGSNAAFAPYQMAVSVSAVPEPSAAWLLGLGCAALGLRLCRHAGRLAHRTIPPLQA